MTRFVFAAMLLTLSACVSHDYAGESYTPTDHVRVFYEGSLVPADYRVIGTDRAETTEYMDTQAIIQDMIKKAQSVGADAIKIEGVQTVAVGSSTTSYGESEDKEYYATTDGELHTRHKNSGKWQENSYTTTTRNKVVTAHFLKQN